MASKPQHYAELALKSAEQWNKHAYEECSLTLKDLAQRLQKHAAENAESPAEEVSARSASAKVMHNAALADFASSKGADSWKLLASFENVMKLLEEESKSIAGPTSPGSEDGDAMKGASGLSGEDSSSAQVRNDTTGAAVDSAGSKTRFQPDSSYALYNCAVVHVNERQWRSALDILENLFRYIDAVDEGLALCICFLLLDVYTLVARGAGASEGGLLVSHVAEQAQSVIDYLEKPHAFNGHKNLSKNGSSQMDGENGDKRKDVSGNDITSDSQQRALEGMQRAWGPAQVKDVMQRLYNYKAKIGLLQAGASNKASVQNVNTDLAQFARAIGESDSSSSSPVLAEDDGSWEGLKLSPGKGGGLRAATPAEQASVQDVISECLRANLAYVNKDFQACSDLLSSSSNKGLNKGIALNNKGCIQHHRGRHHCAAIMFAKALEATKSDPEHCAAEISFNLGVQLLHCGKPVLAHESFLKAAPAAYHRPRLWLHIAECVVMSHAQLLDQEGRVGLLHSVVGEGSERRILLKTNVFPDGLSHEGCSSSGGTSNAPVAGTSLNVSQARKVNGKGKASKASGHKFDVNKANDASAVSGEAASTSLSLESGIRATCHVLYLLNLLEDGSLPGGQPASTQTRKPGSGFPMSNEPDASDLASAKSVSGLDNGADTSREQVLAMRQTALLCQAYLALQVEDWSLAYKASRKVIDMANSSADVLLAMDDAGLAAAHAYCAEASLRSGAIEGEGYRPALDHVAKAMETELARTRPDGVTMEDQDANSERARAALCTNLALVRILKSDLSEAERLLLRALDMVPDFTHAMRLLVYLCLCRGEHDRARRLLKTSR